MAFVRFHYTISLLLSLGINHITTGFTMPSAHERLLEPVNSMLIARDGIRNLPYCYSRQPSRHLILPNLLHLSKNDLEDENDEENPSEAPTIENDNPIFSFFDAIWSSSYFASALFWAPFLANPSLRNKALNYISKMNVVAATPYVCVVVVMGGGYWELENRRNRLTNDVVVRRQKALSSLRRAKQKQLSGEQSDVAAEIDNYEEALRDDLKLRFVLPGVRISNVDDPTVKNSDDVVAARQFLGLQLREDGTLCSPNELK